MAIRELNESNHTAGYKRPRFGNKEAEQDWLDQCKKDKESQKVTSCVARGCSVETIRGTTLREFEPVSAADVGGAANLDRLAKVGAVSIVNEHQAATNRGEFEFVTLTAVVDGRRHFDKGVGFNADELTVPATEPYEAVENGRVAKRAGNPEQPGSERVEDWIKRGIAERARLRDKVIASAKKRLKREAASESGK